MKKCIWRTLACLLLIIGLFCGNDTKVTVNAAPNNNTTMELKAITASDIVVNNTDAKTTRISWPKVEGAAQYYVYRKISTGSYSKIATTTSLSYTDKNVVSGTTYTYAVRAVNGTNIGGYSGKVNMYLDPITNLAAKNTDAKTVQLSWSKINGAAGYYVYRMDPGKSYVKIATITNGATVTYNDKNVVIGTPYRYAVRAINGVYIGNYFSKLNMYLDPITNLVAKNTDAKTVQLSWSKINGAAGYYVYRMDPSKSYVKIATITNGATVTYNDKNVVSGTTYRYAVRAFNGSYIGNYFSKLNMYIDPVVTADISMTNQDGSMKVSWKAIKGATGYRVYRMDPGKSYVLLTTTSGNSSVSCVDKNVSSGVTYRYAIRAVNGSYIGNYLSKTYMYLATPVITGMSDASGAFIEWAAIPGATSYRVYDKEGSSGWRLIDTVDAKDCTNQYWNTCSYLASLPAGSTRTYTVRALASGSISDYKKAGVTVTWEGCPHEYHLTDEVDGYNVKATCDKNGLNVFECIICGDQYSEVVKATGHSFDAGKVTKAATCTTAGVKTYTCSKCGDSYTTSIPATGHSYDTGKVTKAATCTTTGVKTYTCTKCGATKTESIPATGHKAGTPVKENVTATGYDLVTRCSVCNTVLKTEHVTTACSHTYTSAITKAATCTTAGVKTYTCSKCGDSYTESIPASHAWETKNITVTVPDSTTGSVGKYEYIKKYYMKCFDCGAEIHRSDYKSESDWRAAIEAHVAYTNKGHNNYAIYNGTYDVKNLVYSAYPTKQKTIQVTVCSKCGAEKEHVFANISHDTWITDDLFGDIAYSQKTKIGADYYQICNKCGYIDHEGDFATEGEFLDDINNHIIAYGGSYSLYHNDLYEYTGIMYEGHFETTVDGQKCLACGFEK